MAHTAAQTMNAQRISARGLRAYPFGGGIRVAGVGPSGAHVTVRDNAFHGRFVGTAHSFTGLSLPALCRVLRAGTPAAR